MDNKKTTIMIGITLVLVAVLMVVTLVDTGSVPASSPAQSADANDTIVVYGQGKISIKPDVAYIQLGVRNMDINPQKAQDDNAAKMKDVITALQSSGIESDDIQTTVYNVYQQIEHINFEEKLIGYEVTNTVQVTNHDVENAGNVIKIASDAGANKFYGISFDIVERQQAYLDAMDVAMDRAKQKADKLANDADRKVTGVISVQESGTNTSPYSPYQNFAMELSDASNISSDGSISSGEMEISAMVTVIYRLN